MAGAVGRAQVGKRDGGSKGFSFSLNMGLQLMG